MNTSISLSSSPAVPGKRPEALLERFRRIRGMTAALAAPLTAEDCTVQSMPDASPVKWHLAHTSWFFEQFVLQPKLPGYEIFHPEFAYLFNSYYESVGPRHRRPERGLLTRPTLDEVLHFREHVDEAISRLLEHAAAPELATAVELGLQHEQQHQELILMDVKHLLSRNPLKPAYRELEAEFSTLAAPLEFHSCPEGIYEIGHGGGGFCFDNETPRHRVYVNAFALANRLATNGEYLQFISNRGYERPELWLADGWATVQAQAWKRPLYWTDALDAEFTLGGMRELNPAAPVCHVSFYEADAFARWAQARLPTEAEWEVAAAQSGWGQRWEWTNSAYLPYPGYRPPAGAIGEYNGKFMSNQMVMRGASIATPAGHSRGTYRNFFYPHMRWQFSGIRLAKDSRL